MHTNVLDKIIELIATNTRKTTLRYGENPHQQGTFYGNPDEIFEQVAGQKLSSSNLLDIDAGLRLIAEFDQPTFIILKHGNACGVASRPQIQDAWSSALASDPVSAYGGILFSNTPIDLETATQISKIRFVLLIAPAFEEGVTQLLSKNNANRTLLKSKKNIVQKRQIRNILNGFWVQDTDTRAENRDDLSVVTDKNPTEDQLQDMLFANKIAKHTRTSAIVLARNRQLLASGIGQTSRVDALHEAIHKAEGFGFRLKNAVMASEAALPFVDTVQIANYAGINAVVQTGGSPRDSEIIEFCNKNQMTMAFTGIRHFKH